MCFCCHYHSTSVSSPYFIQVQPTLYITSLQLGASLNEIPFCLSLPTHANSFVTCYADLNKLHTGWRTKCHTIDCARNTFLLLQNHLTSGTELILIGWKIVPNEEHFQCDHRFALQPLANEPLH